ncbi:MAG: hypothetical protein M3Q57_06120 [Pseudomonadota bacterium]|nr:hypothetical protein [Pseudomonadota bacterium]
MASHRQGLVEQLEVEAASLAGRARDSAQRTVVYHHLADSLGLGHAYALLAAHGALAIDPAIADLGRQVRRSWWRLRAGERAALLARVAEFGGALRELDQRRCERALLAYRLAAAPGLAEDARQGLDPALVAAFAACRAHRGGPSLDARRALFAAHQRWAEALIGDGIEAAISALDWPLGARTVAAAVALLRIPMSAYERAERRGLERVERELRRSKALPAGFAANPAQAFYALQRQMAERRRRAADEFVDLSPDEAVSLAA